MKESSDSTPDTIPVADLAAEATNDGSPAQSIPETIPPRARAGGDERRTDSGEPTRAGKSPAGREPNRP